MTKAELVSRLTLLPDDATIKIQVFDVPRICRDGGTQASMLDIIVPLNSNSIYITGTNETPDPAVILWR